MAVLGGAARSRIAEGVGVIPQILIELRAGQQEVPDLEGGSELAGCRALFDRLVTFGGEGRAFSGSSEDFFCSSES